MKKCSYQSSRQFFEIEPTILLGFVFFILITGCNENSTGPGADVVTRIETLFPSTGLWLDDTVQLSVRFYESNGAEFPSQQVQWTGMHPDGTNSRRITLEGWIGWGNPTFLRIQ